MKMQAGFTIAISLRTDVSPPSFASVSLGYISSGGHHNGAIKLSEGKSNAHASENRLSQGFRNCLKCLFSRHQKEQA